MTREMLISEENEEESKLFSSLLSLLGGNNMINVVYQGNVYSVRYIKECIADINFNRIMVYHQDSPYYENSNTKKMLRF